MEIYNLNDGELDETWDAPGFGWRGATVGPQIGASMLGMSVYELGERQRICPYHFHWSNEEWLIVVEGEPTLRTPEGERTLRPGDIVCFPVGPQGAHAVTGPAKVAMVSTKQMPSVVEYPDSDKVGFASGETNYIVRRHPELEYLDGET